MWDERRPAAQRHEESAGLGGRVFIFLEAGGRLGWPMTPEGHPDEEETADEKLLRRCWAWAADERPSADHLLDKLRQLL